MKEQREWKLKSIVKTPLKQAIIVREKWFPNYEITCAAREYKKIQGGEGKKVQFEI